MLESVVLVIVALAPFAAMPKVLENARPAPMAERMPNGDRPRETSWLQEDGRYYAVYNQTVRVEISGEEYQRTTRRFWMVFIDGLVGFAIVANFIAWLGWWWPRESTPTTRTPLNA